MLNPIGNFKPSLPCTVDTVDEFLAQPSPATVEALSGQRGPFMVLGAGGKLGLHLCMMLRSSLEILGRSDRVIAVSRFRTLWDREEFTRRGIETLVCDLEDPSALADLPDVPILFFLAGIKFGTQGSPDLLQRANVEVPKRVAERFRGALFVAFSTGCVYPFVTPASGGATEETPPEAYGDYARSCLGRERAFIDAGRRHGTKTVLIRLNYSVEFRYGLLVDVALKIIRGVQIDVTMGYANVIWQTDALNYAIQAVPLATVPVIALNVTGREILSMRQIAGRFSELLNQPAHVVGKEAETAWLNNPERAYAQFGVPETSVDTMIKWVAAWVGSKGTVWDKPTGFERRDGKY